MGLIGQPGRGGDFGGGHAVCEKRFGAPQADSHQHLMRSDMEMRLELALKMVGAEETTLASSSSVRACM